MQNLQINQEYISIFASGGSVLDISEYEFELIKKKSFVITTNYAPINLKGHLNAWSDRSVSTFLEKHFEQNSKDSLFLSREAAFKYGQEFKSKVDHWFNNRGENLQGNFTAGWILQLMNKYFPSKTILLFGWDFYTSEGKEKWYDQYSDYDSHRRGAHYNINQKLRTFSEQIRTFHIDRSRIFNCNPDSCLDMFEKRNWIDILGLNILHLTHTSLAGAPVHLSDCLNRYTTINSKSFLRQEFAKNSKLSNLKWNYDCVEPSKEELKEAGEWADILHHHQRPYIGISKNIPELLQFHAQPNGYKPSQTNSEFNGRKLVIAQYHPRFYKDSKIVPNLIDIWHNDYLPVVKSKKTVKIFYSWASEVKGGWGDKGSLATIQILERIKTHFKDKVEIIIFNNEPPEKCLREKQDAHICIDECVTGSYHLQSLEGCAVAAVTINNIDNITLGYLEKVTGKQGHPFYKSGIENLFDNLCQLISDPEQLASEGKKSRVWMEENWNPRILVHYFIESYEELIRYNSIGKNLNPSSQDLVPMALPPKVKNISLPKVEQITTVNIIHNTEKEIIIQKEQPLEVISGKDIKELHMKYSGEDIYILGTGPSLLNKNPDEFKNKICFSINYAFEKIPSITYYFVHVIEVLRSIEHLIPKHQLILPDTLVPQYYSKRENTQYKTRINNDCEEAYVYPLQNVNLRNLREKHISLNRDSHIFNWSTTTHSAIHLAAYMGAKRIYLVGVDYVLFPNGKVHFETGLNPDYGIQDWSANSKHRQGDLWLKEKLSELGIELTHLE